MNPDLVLLAAYPGEYSQALITEMYNALALQAEGITVVPNVKSKLNLHKLIVKKGAKPYTGTFKSKDGDISFEPRVLEVEKAQRDLAIEPSKYLETFMEQKRGAGENSANLNIPFAEYMWNAVLQELSTEVNLETLYQGVGKAGFAAYGAGAGYAVGALIKYTQDSELRYFRCIEATAAGQNPDTNPEKWEWAGARAIAKGFGKIIDEEIVLNTIDPVVTGPVDAGNAYAKFTAMFRAHENVVKKGTYGKVYTYCSMDDYEALTDDLEEKVKKNYEDVDGVTYLLKTNRNNIIQPVSWLNESRRMISTLNGNLLAGTDLLSDMNVITTIPSHYHIDSSISWMFGTQIKDLKALRVSDQ